MLRRITEIILSVLLIGIGIDVFAQSNDTQAYSFLKIPTAPSVAALGGLQNNLKDVNGFFQNPALVDSAQKGKISSILCLIFNRQNYFRLRVILLLWDVVGV
jgi:hypothetical protein